MSEVSVSSFPYADGACASGEAMRVTLTYTEEVDVTGAPRLKIKMDPTWGEFWADCDGGTGANTLNFAYTVVYPNISPRGIAVLHGSLALNGGAIRSATATPADAGLWHEWLGHDWDHRVDSETPSLLSVTVHATTVAISYGEALDAPSVPPAGAFTVQRTPHGGVQETVSLSGPPEIVGGAVLLTLADPVLTTDTDVKVSYRKPAVAANRVKDKAGNGAALPPENLEVGGIH